MERRNLALLCAGVLCFWLFALAFGTAEGRGVAVQAELPTAAPAAVEDVPVVDAAAQPQLSLNCRAAILVDQDTGTVLYEKNADEQVPIASITKVMTLLLTFEAIHNGQLTLETTVPVSEHAYHMGGSQIWLEPGEQFTLDEMIKAICVSSANDAAVAVAELVGGSEPAFVERMNARAAELGMVPIASITKVMTLLLTFEAIHNGQLTLETTVPVSEHAYHMGGSQIWLEPGEQFTLDEMIKAICVSSANDAAVAVAELVGGSEPAFVERMNARAAELGMEHTTFHNACGLDTEGHLSTARDVAVMSCQILNTCPEVLHYTGIWTDTLRGGATQLVNTNKLLHRYNGITGLKTGTTGGAGVCISASAARDGLRLVAVILGAPSSKDRFEAAAALLDYGFGGWQAAPLPAPEVQPLQLKVKGSAEDSVPLDYSALPQTVLLPREGTAALTAQACLPQQLEAPVEKGQTVGTVQVYHGETLLGEYEVKAAADAPRMDFGTAFSLLWGSLTG